MTASAAVHGARGQHWVAQLARHAHARPEATALRCGAVSHTWRGLADRVLRLGRGLARLGIGAGDRVAFVMGNGTEYVESLLAVGAAGAIGVPVNPRLAAAEVTFILRDCGASLVITDAAFHRLAADAAEDDGIRVVDVSAQAGLPYADLLHGPVAGSPAEELAALTVDESAPALIMYTSGTTGRPKGAVLTHRNLLAQSQTNLVAFRFEMYDEVYLCASPIFHIGAIGGPGEVGEIVYRGPGLMSGYWNLPEATAEAFAGGWFHSGDLVRVDGDGFVHVVDRLKDMIISGGENIYCAEVENVLAAHPDVAEVAVVGRPHLKWGETPVAVVVPAPGRRAPSLEELRDHARRRLAPYKLPTGIEVAERLPRNASGKVLKFELRDGRTDDRVPG